MNDYKYTDYDALIKKGGGDQIYNAGSTNENNQLDDEVFARDFADTYLKNNYGLGKTGSLINWEKDLTNPGKSYFMIDGKKLFDIDSSMIKNGKTVYSQSKLQKLLDKWAYDNGYRKDSTYDPYAGSIAQTKTKLKELTSSNINLANDPAFKNIVKATQDNLADNAKSINEQYLADSRYNNTSSALGSIFNQTKQTGDSIQSYYKSYRSQLEDARKKELERLENRLLELEAQEQRYGKVHYVPGK